MKRSRWMPGIVAGIWLILFAAAPGASAQEAARAVYDRGAEAYRADRFDEALRLFEEFRAAAPADDKADDALWFIGRIQARQGRLEEAERSFRGVLEQAQAGNRRDEAGYDLAKLLADRGDLSGARNVLEPLKTTRNPDSTERRLLRLLAEVRAAQGDEAWKGFRPGEARESYGEAAGLYERLLEDPRDDRERLRLLDALGQAYAGLMDAAPDDGSYLAARGLAASAYGRALDLGPDESKRARLGARLAEVTRPDLARLTGRAALFGRPVTAAVEQPVADASWRAGLLAELDLALELPLGWRQRLVAEAGFSHDDLHAKVSNFPAGETGAARIRQRIDDLSASVAWEAGTRRALLSELSVGGEFRLAEDPGDSSLALRVGEKLDWRVSPAWKLGLDGSLEWKVYPDYLTAAGRELDRVEAGIGPNASWYFLPDLRLDLGYDFALRRYLNAVYPPSAADKSYLIHTAGVGLRATPGRIVRASLGYTFTWNDSRDYTVTVIGDPADQVVADYYDYTEHAVKAGLLLRWSPAFSTEIGGSVAFQGFRSYPARDASRAFTGEKRRDTHLSLDGQMRVLLAKKGPSLPAALWADLRAEYDRNLSNAVYEESIQTNYRAFSAYAGLQLELR